MRLDPPSRMTFWYNASWLVGLLTTLVFTLHSIWSHS